MKKIGLKVLNVGIAFIMLFSGVAGLGEVLLNATEITTENTQNEPETTSVGDEETSEVVEETTTEETTVAVEESTDLIKSAAEESNMVVQAAISEEEQQLLNQLNPRMKSLESEQTDFLTAEDTADSFVVFLKEDSDLYNSATEVFSASAGKSVASELSTLIVTKDDSAVSDDQFINDLTTLSNVEFVEKNVESEMTTFMTPNDTYFGYQWEMSQMNMTKVWDLGAGKNVKIGIFDTGFQSMYLDTNGVEFDRARILPLVTYSANNLCYGSGTHGTEVLSIAGGVKTNNARGMSGVAYQSTFQPYMAGASCDSNGRFNLESANFVKVYNHAMANGVSIMNMSFGGTSQNSTQKEVIQRATSKGLISVAARGNDGDEANPTVTNYPACYSGVIMVGALTQSNALASFSTYGDCGNKNLVTAYGANVMTATFEYGSDKYWLTDGTSFSSPIVVGVLAVMKSAKPSATAAELKNALLSSATDLGAGGYDQRYGYGGINPLAAIQKLNPYVVVDGNYVFYLNKDKTINTAKRKNSSGVVVSIYNFYPNTKYDSNKWKHVSFEYSVDKNNNIVLGKRKADITGRVTIIYDFYTNTKYDSNRWKHLRYEYALDSNGNITSAKRKVDNTGRVTMIYNFYPNTKYDSNRWKHLWFEYTLDSNGNITSAKRRVDKTGQVIIIYNFYPNTKYDANRWKHVQFAYFMNGKYIKYAYRYNNNSTKAIIKYTFKPNTLFDGNRWNKVATTTKI